MGGEYVDVFSSSFTVFYTADPVISSLDIIFGVVFSAPITLTELSGCPVHPSMGHFTSVKNRTHFHPVYGGRSDANMVRKPGLCSELQ